MSALYREEDRLNKTLQEIYKSVPRPPKFTDEDFKKASEKIQNFASLRMADLKSHSNEPWLKILVLSGAIGAKYGSVVRLF